jgi:uncharacterized RDD family membrane protein YckC
VTPCPRCAHENPPTAASCAGCGTPLAFDEDPAPAPARLAVELDLDRRNRDAPPPTDEPEPPEPPELDALEPRPAPPARRAAAWAVDGGLVGAAAVLVPWAILGGRWESGTVLLLSEAFVAVVAFVYATAAHALAGATLGKRIAHLRVIDEDGRMPGPATSAARSAWAVLSLALAGAGFVPALVTPSRRALHDLLAGTRVVESP